MLRRTKATVEMSVPPRVEQTIFVPLADAQRFWTLRLLTRLDAVDLKQIFAEDFSTGNVEADEGRRQVMRQLTEQVNQTKTGENNREYTTLPDGPSIYMLFCRVEASHEPVNATPQSL